MKGLKSAKSFEKNWKIIWTLELQLSLEIHPLNDNDQNLII